MGWLMMMDTPSLRIEARFKNARLYNAIVADAVPPMGLTVQARASEENGPVHRWCKAYGLVPQRVYLLINLRLGPVCRTPQGREYIRPICVRIANILQQDLADLFPEDLYRITWPVRVVAETEPSRFLPLSAARHVAALPGVVEDQTAERELHEVMLGALETLTPSEASVIRRRFGFDGPEQTFEEVAQTRGVSRERIRQIECKALRKLRHPSRSRAMRAFVRE